MTVADVPQREKESMSTGTQVPFDSIHEPGTYVCNWSGHLLRIPEDAISRGRSPLVDLRAREPLFTTKISDDPYVTMTKARLAAADADVPVNF